MKFIARPFPGRLIHFAFVALIGFVVAINMPAMAQTEAEVKAQIAKLKPRDFPTQQIEATVVYPAGGGMDINGRFVAKFFEKYTDQKIAVNNRTGGAGLVGHTYLATQAKNDGYTVGVVATLIFGDSMLRSGGRWSYTDLDPIAFLNSDAMLLVVSDDGPYKDKSLKDIIEIAKAKPNTVRLSIVPGTMYEYMVEQLEQISGAKFLKVPFQGGAPGVTAMLGNNVDVSIAFYGEVRSFLEAKKVIPIGVTSAERSPFAPNAPTLNEVMNSKDFTWTIIRWLVVPKGTPPDRKAWLAAGFGAAIRDPELQNEFRKIGAIPNIQISGPEQTAAIVKESGERERAFYLKSGRLK